MRYRLKPFFACALLLAAAGGAYGLNLIVKERFDRGISGWAPLGSDASVTWDRTEGWLSPGALRLTSSAPAERLEIAGRCFKLIPGEVRATGRVKAPIPENVHCFVGPTLYRGEDCTGDRTVIIHGIPVIGHTGDWDSSSHRLRSWNTTDYFSVRVHLTMLNREPGDECLFDDVILHIGDGPAEIPTLARLGVVLLVLSLLSFALAAIRRRKAKP